VVDELASLTIRHAEGDALYEWQIAAGREADACATDRIAPLRYMIKVRRAPEPCRTQQFAAGKFHSIATSAIESALATRDVQRLRSLRIGDELALLFVEVFQVVLEVRIAFF